MKRNGAKWTSILNSQILKKKSRRIDAALAKRDAVEQMLLKAHDIESHSKHRSVFGSACQMYDSLGGA